MSGPTFVAGRDNKGAFAIGTGSVATMTGDTAPDPNVDIMAALIALRDIMKNVPGIESKVLTRLDEAQDEAAKSAPKREEVRSLVAQATNYARDAAGFAEAAERLIPHLRHIAAWVGSTWQTWAPTIGLG